MKEVLKFLGGFIIGILLFLIFKSSIENSFDAKHYKEIKSYITKDGTLIINIKAYGAKGDGVTDDSKAFYEAIHDANSFTLDGTPMKSVLVIPKGKYIIKN